MKTEKEKLFATISTTFDILLSLVALFAAYYIRKHLFKDELAYSVEYFAVGMFMIPTWAILIHFFQLHKIDSKKNVTTLVVRYIALILVGLAILLLFISIAKLKLISRIVIFLFGIIYFVLLLLARYFLVKLAIRTNLDIFEERNLLIIADDSADLYIDRIEKNEILGLNITTIITNSQIIKEKYSGKYKIFPETTNIDDYLRLKDVDEVMFIKSIIKQDEILPIIFSCKEIGVPFKIQSDFMNLVATKGNYENTDDIGLITLPCTSTDWLALSFKTAFDYVFSILFLVCSFPFLVILAILIKCTSPGPVLFKQKRVGLRGREFTLFKFRTMVVNAEELKDSLMAQNESDGPVFKMKNDPRMTKIGRFLRKTSIDEIPQFVNVLLGHMSVIGPRPPLPKEVSKYERWQLRKLSMKPGITCIWQVSGRNELTFEEWMRLDLQYIDTWSIKLDVQIFVETIQTVFKMNGH